MNIVEEMTSKSDLEGKWLIPKALGEGISAHG